MKEKKRTPRAVLAIIGIFCVFSLGYLLGTHQSSAPYFVMVKSQQEMATIVAVPPSTEGEDIASLLPNEIININTADSKDLDRLPNIGPSRVASIVAWRDEYGPFETIEDIMEVDGIGQVTFQTIQNYITVGGENNDGEDISGGR